MNSPKATAMMLAAFGRRDETEDDEGESDGGITPKGQALGHRYVMGNVNAYCPQCTQEQSEAADRTITVLDCDYDLDK